MEVWWSKQSVASVSRSSYTLPFMNLERIIPYNGCSSKLLPEKKKAPFTMGRRGQIVGRAAVDAVNSGLRMRLGGSLYGQP
jgi:hypothetical protein